LEIPIIHEYGTYRPKPIKLKWPRRPS